MIAIRLARHEKRMNEKRRRLILIIGHRSWHITQEEARSLAHEIIRLTNIPRTLPLFD